MLGQILSGLLVSGPTIVRINIVSIHIVRINIVRTNIVVLKIVRIKCRLGYAEVHKPAPGFGPGEVEVGTVDQFPIPKVFR